MTTWNDADPGSRILTMVKDTVVLDHVVCLRPQVAPIAEAVLHRQMLCSMRLVSNGWKAASEWGFNATICRHRALNHA